MKNSYFFPHDFNARTDEKIIELIRVKGWEGYGLYWGIIEKLHGAGGYLILNYESIAFDMRTQCDCIKDLIHNFDLFEINDTKFTCQRVLRNLEYKENKSQKGRESAIKRWKNANPMPSQCQPNAINDINDINKTKQYKHFHPPTLIEVKKYCQERTNKVDAAKFINFYESKGWMIGKNKMKSWQAAVRTWEIKEEQYKPIKTTQVSEVHGSSVPVASLVLDQMAKWEKEQKGQ